MPQKMVKAPTPKKKRRRKKAPRFNSNWDPHTKFTDEPVTVTQAERIIEKFGGVSNLLVALAEIGKGRNKTSVYRWTYPPGEKNGTGGIVPTAALRDVIAAARNEGVFLSTEDLDPRTSIKNKRTYEKPPKKKKR